MFNLRVEIIAELSWTWSRVLTYTQKCGNYRPHLLKLIWDWICRSGGSRDLRLSSLRTGARNLMSNIWCNVDFHLRFCVPGCIWNWGCGCRRPLGWLECRILLMWPHRKLKLSFSQVCRSVLFSAACPDFVWVSLPYLVRWVLNHFFTVLIGKFLVAATKIFLSSACLWNCRWSCHKFLVLFNKLHDGFFVWITQQDGLHLALLLSGLSWFYIMSMSVRALFSPLSWLSSLLSLSILSLSLSSCSFLSLPSLSSLSLLFLSISSAVSPNSNCGWVSVGTSIFLLLPLGMLINQSINQLVWKKKT